MLLLTRLLKTSITIALLPLSVVAESNTVTVTGHSGISYLGIRNATNKQDIFLGVPFAQAPIGELRFKAPQPWTPTNSITLVNATVARSICVQNILVKFGPWPISEDCLHLNIWKPSDITSPLPVLVYIHGGAFRAGTALLFPGDQLLNTAIQLNKPVVYVAFNYRVGILGFPPGQQSEAAGALNLGLKDQRLALEWINKNIALFGGDPSKVMLFGESSGAMSVAYQMMYNHGNIRGVFRAALMLSGSPSSTPARLASYPPRQAMYNYIANATGCSVNDFECVRRADLDVLIKASNDILAVPAQFQSKYSYPIAIGPTLSASDPFLCQLPKLSLKQGKFARIPFVCGTSVDEGTNFAANLSTTQEVISFFGAELPGLSLGIANTTVVELLKYYPDDPSAGSPYNTGNKTFGRAPQYKRTASVIGDLLFEAPRRDFLQAAVSFNVPAWSYQFAQPGSNYADVGLAHGDELPFIFQNLGTGAPQDQVDLSVAMLDYMITLAYKLDPSTTGNPSRVAWPVYGNTANSLKFVAGNTTPISDTFRSDAIKFIQSRILI